MRMRWNLALMSMAMLAGIGWAAEPHGSKAPNCPPIVFPPGTAPAPGTKPAPLPGAGVPAQPVAPADMASAAPSGGTSGVESGDNQLIGDLGAFGSANVLGFRLTTTGAVSSRQYIPVPRIVYGGFKVTENESPRPVDRVYLGYNYFNNSNYGVESYDLHRETAGFEKTFLDGNASVGLRVPYIHQSGNGVSGSDFGDITAVLKLALYNDSDSGNLISAGLLVTFPTAGDKLTNGTVSVGTGSTASLVSYDLKDDSYLFQPFVGYIYKMDRLYVQGFSALVFSSETDRDPVLLTNDVGIGYQLIQSTDGGAIRSLAPAIEGHLTTPLSKRNGDDGVLVGSNGSVLSYPDIFVMTAGVHVGLFERLNVTVGAAAPLSGPKPFDFEGIVQMNLRF